MWQNTLTTMVRYLANDFGSTQTYTDDKLEELCVIAGLIVSQEYLFSNPTVYQNQNPTDNLAILSNSFPFSLSPLYIFDVDNVNISPDPTLPATYDPAAIALFTLKAACILTMDQWQGAIGTGIIVRDGDSMVDTVGALRSYKDLIQVGPCAAYEKVKRFRETQNSMLRGKSIMGPMSSYDFLITNSFNIQMFFDSFLLR